MRGLFGVAAIAMPLAIACSKTKTPDPAASTCASDDDCVFSCESKGDCCHDPYCEAPALAAQARAAAEYNREHCTQKDYDMCPRIGARSPMSYRPVLHCRAGACVVDKIPCEGGVCAP